MSDTKRDKTTVVYHSADFDGLFCRAIAERFLGKDGVVYTGWNFGDPKILVPADGKVYVMDLPLDCLENLPELDGTRSRLVWIDHHKTIIDKWGGLGIPGVRIDGVAACRIAWQWFKGEATGWFKEAYVKRRVDEPLALTLAGEYDVAGPGANEEALDFQFGLRSLDDSVLGGLLEDGSDVDYVSRRGRIVRDYLSKADALAAKSAFPLELDGLKCMAVNGYRGNSKAMQDLAAASGCDAVLSFAFRGKHWTVSLYGVPGRDVDLSEVAKRRGGGGHKGACGFECAVLPFDLGVKA